VELNGKKRSCRLRVEIVVETRRKQPDDKKTELPFATKSNFRFKPSQSAERINGADMNFVE